MFQLWINMPHLQPRVFAVFDGGAEVAVLSNCLYSQMDPKPELRTTIEGIHGLVDAAKMNCMGIQLKYDEKVMVCHDKMTRGIARLRGEHRMRWLSLSQESHQLVQGKA